MKPTQTTMQVAVLALAALALAGCASSTTGSSADGTQATVQPAPGATSSSPFPSQSPIPAGASGSPRAPLPNPAKVNGQNPNAVAEAALTIMFSSDTRLDTSPRDATVRAAPFLTAQYAAALAGHQAIAAPGVQWNQWAAHDAYTTATVTPAPDSGAPADTTTTAYRTYTVTVTAHGTDGYTDTQTIGTAFVELGRNSSTDPWRVSTLQIR